MIERTENTENFAHLTPAAWAAPLRGRFRVQPQDFRVEEQMDIALSDAGEHLWLHVRKTGANTDWVAGQLARCAGAPARDVGFAGLKDRHAVTTQWFSLQLPGKADPDFSALPPEIEILQAQRHDKKLRRGALTCNRFTLVLRDCAGDLAQAETIWADIAAQGMPNYFGEQRFGHALGNLAQVERWFSGNFEPRNRNKRSLYLSAARSWLFNALLAERVRRGDWNQRLAGDVFVLDGGHAWFADDASPDLAQRLATLDIHASGVLWGRGELPTQAEARALETAVAEQHALLCAGLERQGLKQERRALRVRVGAMQFDALDASTVRVSFELPPGAYATVLLAQLGQFGSGSAGAAGGEGES